MNNAIQEELSKQMDIVEILRWFRIFKFMSIVSLRKNQAQMVKFFKAYTIQAKDEHRIEEGVAESGEI